MNAPGAPRNQDHPAGTFRRRRAGECFIRFRGPASAGICGAPIGQDSRSATGQWRSHGPASGRGNHDRWSEARHDISWRRTAGPPSYFLPDGARGPGGERADASPGERRPGPGKRAGARRKGAGRCRAGGARHCDRARSLRRAREGTRAGAGLPRKGRRRWRPGREDGEAGPPTRQHGGTIAARTSTPLRAAPPTVP